MIRYAIAVEFGGQSVKIARVRSDGVVEDTYRFSLNQERPVSRNLFLLKHQESIKLLSAEHEIHAVGVASPNPYDSGSINLRFAQKPAYKNIIDFPLRDIILEAAHCNHLSDIYDAGAAVKGELWMGDIPQSGKILYLTLGTGLGACFIKDGKIIKGIEGATNSGELWDCQFQRC